MKTVPRPFLFLLVLTGLLAATHTLLLGRFLKPVLERTLTSLFGMPVGLESLQADIFTGQVTASGLDFHNQPEYSDAPHLWVRRLEFTVAVRALLDQQVVISRADFYEPYFLIERRKTQDGKLTNIVTWVRHIKAWKAGRPKGPPGGKGWTVEIPVINIHGGTFIYDDRTNPLLENRFVFDRLEGGLEGFQWPTESPVNLTQAVTLKGFFGAERPAPFEITGNANFATREVSFDLQGKTTQGKIGEYKRFWKDVPIDVHEGSFDLQIRMICVQKMIRTRTHLRLYDLKVFPGARPTEFFLGLPYTTALGFLQSQKEIHLRVPVSGWIQDPKFEFNRAFGQAFQKSLTKKIQGSLKAIKATPLILAEQTGKVVTETQAKISSGLGKITTLVVKKEEIS